MSQCPVCQGKIEGNFGMVVCPSCATAIFFDISGHPQVAGAEPAVETSPEDFEPTIYAASDNDQTVYVSQETIVVPRQAPELSYNSQDEYVAEVAPASESFEAPVIENDNLENVVVIEEEVPMTEELFDPNAFIAQQDLAPMNSEQALGEIETFANSDVESQGLTYNLRITGIDTSEIRQELLEELRDSRFGWSIDQIAAQIKRGELYLTQLNAVKASVIVSRLKAVGVEIDWSQNV